MLEVPWVLNRRGGRTELRLNGAPVRTPAQSHAGFVTAVGRAFQWKDEILAGKVSTIQALAHREGLTRRYVMRVLRLSFLAPDLIDAILAGHQPPTFTLEPFRRPIPLEWAAQRTWFGSRRCEPVSPENRVVVRSIRPRALSVPHSKAPWDRQNPARENRPKKGTLSGG